MASYEGVNFQSLDTFLIALHSLTYKDNIAQNKENKIIIMGISPEFFFLEFQSMASAPDDSFLSSTKTPETH